MKGETTAAAPGRTAVPPDALRALRRGWWLVLLVALVTAAAAAVLTSRQPRVFRATALLVVVPNETVEGTSDMLRSLDTLERRTVVATYSRIAAAPDTRAAVAALLDEDSRGLAGYAIRGSVLPSTNLIQIEVTGPDRARAETIAGATAQVVRREARGLYRIFSVRSFATASASSRPISPDPRRNLLVACVVGLFLGLLGALAFDALRGPRS